MKDLLINTWYVAAPASEIDADRPRRVRMLGLDFVLFRDADGALHCLSDVCCHRGGSLAERDLTDGCVQCAYHGWTFDGAGRCTGIPSMGEGARVPKRARVDSYPAQEKYGLAWVFLGDLPESERPMLPGWLDAFEGQPDKHWFMQYEKHQPGINWMRMMENSMDNSHLSFVHPMFGGRIDPRVSSMEITDTHWGAHTGLLMPTTDDSAKPEYMQEVLDKDREPMGVQLEFSMAGMCVVIRQNLAPGVSQYLLTTKTPIDEWNTQTYGMQMRTYMIGAENDEKISASLGRALDEDFAAVSAVRPVFTPTSPGDELLVEADSLELAFRRRYMEWVARGWAIDSDAFHARRESEVMVIPSPARREDPKNWVHGSVPLLEPVAAAERKTAWK
jgi:phenylpropionate dioxygenase-like ring-hydroxylating dioxygenase large terminal subunit